MQGMQFWFKLSDPPLSWGTKLSRSNFIFVNLEDKCLNSPVCLFSLL